MAKDSGKGQCFIDGRRTTVAERRTVVGVKVKTCADGKGCDNGKK